jgi:hypothetical protein
MVLSSEDQEKTKEVFRAAWNIVFIYNNRPLTKNPRAKEIYANAVKILRNYYDINEQDVKYYMQSQDEE